MVLVAWLVYKLVSMVSVDLHGQHQIETERQMSEIERCRDNYYLNKCEPHHRVPAAESYCQEVEMCMNTPVHATIKTINSMFALIAQAFNSFTSHLTLMSLFLVCFTLFLSSKYGCCCKSSNRQEIDSKVETLPANLLAIKP